MVMDHASVQGAARISTAKVELHRMEFANVLTGLALTVTFYSEPA